MIENKDILKPFYCFVAVASKDVYKTHFATENKLITPVTVEAAKEAKWITSKVARPALGQLTEATLDVPSFKKQEISVTPVVSCESFTE